MDGCVFSLTSPSTKTGGFVNENGGVCQRYRGAGLYSFASWPTNFVCFRLFCV